MNHLLSGDQGFLEKLTGIVLANLSNEQFGVSELSLEAGLSRSVLHRRLRALRDQNVSQFIREIRLKEALKLLKQSEDSVAEIAYKVGFGSPAYFSKCFHAYFECTPLEAKTRDFPGIWPEAEPVKASPESPVGEAKTRKPGKILVVAASALLFLLAVWVLVNVTVGRNPLELPGGKASQASVVVLPFKNFSGDPENQYLADGLMEDILNNLYKVSELRVISRTTSEYYGHKDLSARDIARELHAANVLEGSIRRHGDQLRVSVQLIDAEREAHLWSENYDRAMGDVLGIQTHIALRVDEKLNALIPRKEIRQMGLASTQNPEAYDHFLRGRFLLYQAATEQRADINRTGLINSLQCFEKAIEADPVFAQAYAELGNAWLNLSAWGWYQPYEEGIENARKYTTRALELDPECAVAHCIRGTYLVWPGRQLEEGRRELLTALRLNPNYPYAVQIMTQLLMITGPIEESRRYMDRALELEPYFWVVHNLNAWVFYFEEKYDKALEACETARDLNPGFVENRWLFFLNYARTGQGALAAQTLGEIASLFPGATGLPDEIMEAYQQEGIPGLFRWLIVLNRERPIPVPGMNGHPYYLGWWSALAGDAEGTIHWFQVNLEQKSQLGHYFYLIATNPDFDFLRQDPRFLAIVDTMGLSPYHYRAQR